MSPASDMSHRHAAHLAELAELGMALARDLQQQALAADTPDEKAGLAQAFHSIARTVRQSMALEARLAREARRETVEAESRATRAEAASVAARKAEVRARVRGLVWDEAEASDCAALIDDLDDRLSDAEHLPGFTDEEIDAHVQRLRGELGLTPGVPAARRRSKPGEAPTGPVEIKVRFVNPGPEMAGLLDDDGYVIDGFRRPP